MLYAQRDRREEQVYVGRGSRCDANVLGCRNGCDVPCLPIGPENRGTYAVRSFLRQVYLLNQRRFRWQELPRDHQGPLVRAVVDEESDGAARGRRIRDMNEQAPGGYARFEAG